MSAVVIAIVCTIIVSTAIATFIFLKVNRGIREENEKLKKENQDIKNAEKFKRYAKDLARMTPGRTIIGVNAGNKLEIEVVQEIGNGAQGKVFHVKVKEEDMALKIFCPSKAVFTMGNEIVNEAHKRFKNEKLIEAVSHENIVKIHNYFDNIILTRTKTERVEDIAHIYKLQLLSEQNLELEEIKKRTRKIGISKKKRLPLPAFTMDLYEGNLLEAVKYEKIDHSIFENSQVTKKVLKALCKLIAAVEYLHSKKIIHRDIKPENLMVKENITALGDFGVAYWKDFVTSSGQSMTNINTNFAPGTHAYIAPELQKVSGDIKFTKESDIYSLGLTILRVIFKDPKNRILTLQDLSIIEAKAKTYSAKKQNTVVHITHLIRKCCEQDPEKRPDIKAVKEYFSNIKKLWQTGKTFDDEIRIPKKTFLDYCRKYKKTTAIVATIALIVSTVLVFNTYTDYMTNRYTIQIQNGTQEEKLTALIWLCNERTLQPETNWKKIPMVQNVNISNLDFSGASLLSIKTKNLRAVSTNLRAANLTGANLTEADLSKSTLAFANLANVNLANAKLSEVDLMGANLEGANLTETNITEANLTKTNLAGANLTNANLTNANLEHADLTKANLTRANLNWTKLLETNLTKANLAGINLRQTILLRANLNNAVLYKVGININLFNPKSIHGIKLLPISTMLAIKKNNPELISWWSFETDKHSEEYFANVLENAGLSLKLVMSENFKESFLMKSIIKDNTAVKELVKQIRPDLFRK